MRIWNFLFNCYLDTVIENPPLRSIKYNLGQQSLSLTGILRQWLYPVNNFFPLPQQQRHNKNKKTSCYVQNINSSLLAKVIKIPSGNTLYYLWNKHYLKITQNASTTNEPSKISTCHSTFENWFSCHQPSQVSLLQVVCNVAQTSTEHLTR